MSFFLRSLSAKAFLYNSPKSMGALVFTLPTPLSWGLSLVARQIQNLRDFTEVAGAAIARRRRRDAIGSSPCWTPVDTFLTAHEKPRRSRSEERRVGKESRQQSVAAQWKKRQWYGNST